MLSEQSLYHNTRRVTTAATSQARKHTTSATYSIQRANFCALFCAFSGDSMPFAQASSWLVAA